MEFQVLLNDKPRQLARLLDIVGDEGANILAVLHERDDTDIDVGTCLVGLKLETRGRDHMEHLRESLERHGYSLYFQEHAL